MITINIGITFFWGESYNHIWSNGAGQNMYFLKQCLEQIDGVESVYFVYWRNDKSSISDNMRLDLMDIDIYDSDEVIDKTDVLIEGTLTLEPQIEEEYRKRGAKIVSYRMGNDFIADMEKMVHDKPGARAFNGTKYDAVWMIPQHENTCKSYFSIMYRCPAYVVPAIWSPVFCDQVIKRIKEKHNLTFGYKPDTEKKAKRIASFEANINIVKTCFTPVLIAEQAYREAPEKIKNVYMCNTYDKKDNPTFFNFIGRTNLVKNGVMTVEGRYQMPDFLTRYVDIVLSHQWENGLNYAYNDALYGGYPFIHNSKLIPKGVGYYYDQFDAFEGAKVLLDVIDNHDKHHEEYVKRANEYLDSQLPTNPVNIYLYEKEIKRLFSE